MSTNRLLFKLAKQSFGLMFLSGTLAFSSALFNGVGITLVIPLVLNFLGLSITQSADLPPILDSLFSLFDGVPDGYRSIAMVGTVVIMILLKNLANYASAITSGVLGRNFSSRMRLDGFRLLLDVDIAYFAERRLGELMNSINGEVNRVSAAIRTLVNITVSSITILVFANILLLISWRLTLIAVVSLSTVAIINQFLIKYSKAAGQKLSFYSGALSSKAIEVLSGIRLVKSVANEEAEYKTLKRLIEEREKAAYHSQLVFASVGPLNEVISTLALIFLIFMGRIIFAGQIDAFSSIILTYLFIMTRMLPFISQLNSARNQLANSAASIDILEDFLDIENKPIMASGNVGFKGLEREIQFSNLWFRYPNSDRWTLQDIDIALPKGQTLALVGSSGAGKSTMADLLARFYEPDKGSVKIDGVDLKDMDLHQYRSRIGIVSQDTFLFNATVSDNIRYGCPDATDEAVYQAAQRANAAEFIKNLEEGFSTQIGDRGVMLSGGQRQRLAIARALLQDPEILILDEATSALDTVSERLVQEALENLSQERTTLVIAHRLSTVQKAHQIAVLDRGKIVEVGNHKELLEKEGYYAKLYEMQFSDIPKSKPTYFPEENQNHRKDFRRSSYEIRSQLSGMLGALGLLDENFTDESEDYEELTSQAYQSILNVLQSLEQLERQILSTKS
ncbi:MAG: ABC transporter ATP-binding protein [Cyanobacteria bacterium P01_D01_bin.71]